jgi:hypothetical protein
MLSFGDPCPFAQAIKSDRFDCAAVVSNDSDLEFALTIAKLRRHKKVFLFTPGAPTRVPVGRLTRWAHTRNLRSMRRFWLRANSPTRSRKQRFPSRRVGSRDGLGGATNAYSWTIRNFPPISFPASRMGCSAMRSIGRGG